MLQIALAKKLPLSRRGFKEMYHFAELNPVIKNDNWHVD